MFTIVIFGDTGASSETRQFRFTTNLDSSRHNSGGAGSFGRAYWRVEGSLLDLTTVQPVAFFTWNAQTFGARMVRRGLVFLMAALRPFLYASNRVFATRVVYGVLRGVSRDRLDLLGEEYFQYKMKPYLKPDGLARLKQLQQEGAEIVLVSQGLDHVMRPLALHLGVQWLVSNRLDFRDRVATGRLLAPVIRPRGLFARITGAGPDGRREPKRLVRELNLSGGINALAAATIPAERPVHRAERPVVYFDNHHQVKPLSVRAASPDAAHPRRRARAIEDRSRGALVDVGRPLARTHDRGRLRLRDRPLQDRARVARPRGARAPLRARVAVEVPLPGDLPRLARSQQQHLHGVYARQVPELGLHLPSNAVGKDFLPGAGFFAAAPSGSGFQVSLYGLAGILIAADEGFELNLLGRIPRLQEIGRSLADEIDSPAYRGRPLTLVGHSQGGLVILSYLSDVLSRVQAAIIMIPTAPPK